MQLPTWEERVRYLSTGNRVGENKFGSHRALNQTFYKDSTFQRDTRNRIILRDGGCDLACPDRPIPTHDPRYGKKSIYERAYIHHINEVTEEQILNRDPCLWDPENLILCSYTTHNLIHYGVTDPKEHVWTERTPDDTCPWKGGKGVS